MNVSILFIFAFFGFPVLMLVIAGSVRTDINAKNFLFSGVSFFVILLSTVSSIIGVACLLSGIVGLSALYGAAVGIAVLLSFSVLYPIVAYRMFKSDVVGEEFEFDKFTKNRPARTVLYFLIEPLPSTSRRAFYLYYNLLIVSMLIIESIYLYIWMKYNFKIFDGGDVVFYFLFQVITIAYVQGSGYRGVLRTDRTQCAVIFATCAIGLLVFLNATVMTQGLEESMLYLGSTMLLQSDISQVFPSWFNTAFCAFGLVVLAGGWFLSSPDMWVRMSRSIYRRQSSGELMVGGAHPASLKVFFVIAGGLIGATLLLPFLIGLAGFGEGDLSGSTNILAEKARVAIEKIFLFTFTAEPDPRWGAFGGLQEMVAFGFLVLLALAAMTTIDTTAISLVQIKYDYDVNIIGTAKADGFFDRYQKRIIKVFLYVMFLPPIIDFILLKDGLLAFAGFFGMILGGFAVSMMVTIFVRIRYKDAFQSLGESLWWRFLAGCLSAILLWFTGYIVAKLAEGTSAAAWVPFEPEPWLNLGQMACLQALTMGIAYWPIIGGSAKTSGVAQAME